MTSAGPLLIYLSFVYDGSALKKKVLVTRRILGLAKYAGPKLDAVLAQFSFPFAAVV